MAKPSHYQAETLDRYRVYWEDYTYATCWDENARSYPDQEALVDSQQRITWSQARQLTDRLAIGLLELGIKRDEVLVLQLPNSVGLYLWRVACEKAGILSISVLRSFRQQEMEYVLRHLEAAGVVIPWQWGERDYYDETRNLGRKLPALKHIFIAGKAAPPGTIPTAALFEQPAESKHPADYLSQFRYRSDDIMLFCTSGTTGFPKFVEQPIGARIYSSTLRAKILGVTHKDTLAGLALSGTGANAMPFLMGSLVGAKSVLLESFDAEKALELLQRERVTILTSVPAILLMIVNHPEFPKYDLSALRIMSFGGVPMPYAQAVELQGKVSCTVVQGYGAAEMGFGCYSRPQDPIEVCLGTAGQAYGGQVKLVDDAGREIGPGEIGEVLAKGPGAASGYYRDPQATQEMWPDGWYHTGDLGHFDAQGNLAIVGRKKDMIIRGGQNIYPLSWKIYYPPTPK